jgi:hypothetical protein
MDLSLLGLTLAIILLAVTVYLQGQLVQNLIDSFTRVESRLQTYSLPQEHFIVKNIPMTFFQEHELRPEDEEETTTTNIKIETIPEEEPELSSETL